MFVDGSKYKVQNEKIQPGPENRDKHVPTYHKMFSYTPIPNRHISYKIREENDNNLEGGFARI